MTDPSTVLDRFAPQLRWIIDSIRSSFELPEHEIDDLRQEANILLMSYAGLMPGTHYGALAEIETSVNGDEKQVRHVLAFRLRKDLTQQVSRAQRRLINVSDTTIDDLLTSGDEPECESYEREYFEMLDESRMREKYPEFAMQTFDNKSIADIMAATENSRATVFRRIDAQKRSFISAKLRSKGLVVEGDETLEELEEALQHLNAIA